MAAEGIFVATGDILVLLGVSLWLLVSWWLMDILVAAEGILLAPGDNLMAAGGI